MDNTVLEHISINTSDWVALAVFMLLVVGFAAWAKFSTKGSEDFFLAGRSMGWFIVMMSTFATLFSTISFVSVPGQAYSDGMQMSLIDLVNYCSMPLAIYVVLRFYFFARTFSVYEYMEKRFNPTMRVLGSVSFILFRAVYAGSQGKGLSFVAEKDFWRLDLYSSRLCIWAFTWSWILPIGALAMDQSTVQRLLSSKGIKPATKAMYGNLLLSIPVDAVYFLLQRAEHICRTENSLVLARFTGGNIANDLTSGIFYFLAKPQKPD